MDSKIACSNPESIGSALDVNFRSGFVAHGGQVPYFYTRLDVQRFGECLLARACASRADWIPLANIGAGPLPQKWAK